MAKFHEIYATNEQPFKIRCVGGDTATCRSNAVVWDKSGATVSAVSAATWEWELIKEPTVEDVLRERGYAIFSDNGTMMLICEAAASRPCSRSLNCPRLTSLAEATRICDFLDSLGSGK